MRYEISESTIVFFYDNPKREADSRVFLAHKKTSLSAAEINLICDQICRQAQGKKPGTQRAYVQNCGKSLFSYFSETNTPYPKTSDDWQIFVLDFFYFYLTSEAWSKATATTRIQGWRHLITAMFGFWIAEEIIPCDVVIPTTQLKVIISETKNQPLLGRHSPKIYPVAKTPQKLLTSIDFAKSDANYLETIERACRHKISLIRDVCVAHWETLMRDGQTGKNLANEITLTEIDEAISKSRYTEQINTKRWKPSPMACPTHPKGHLWSLALARLWLSTGTTPTVIAANTLRASPFFGKKMFAGFDYGAALASHTSMDTELFMRIDSLSQFYRFVGTLSNLDVTAACCLLTIEHPEFTSESIRNARLLNPQGKPHLLLTDHAGSSIFSVDKPRAGRRQSVVLSPLAYKLISDIIEWTAPVRKILKQSGDKAWRYLFLGVRQRGILGPINIQTQYLNNSWGNSLTHWYPSLVENGLSTGTFDYRRIRTTMGVLRWFETGSTLEMSRTLGNTRNVAIKHYLPTTLLHAWNTRIIRRFQNTLIVLAAHDEDYLLDVSDFSSIADLQDFVAQLILDYPADSSPVADELHARFAHPLSRAGVPSPKITSRDILNVRLSATSLAYLYAFSDFAINHLSDEDLCRVDLQSRLAPQQFVDLARLIRHACESEEIENNLRELLDVPSLRAAHIRAIAQQDNIGKKLSNLAISSHWGKHV